LDSAIRKQIPKDAFPAVLSAEGPVRGTVVRVERLAVHDGPGIRTVVFLKGCPLHCDWCSSPETQLQEPELFFDSRRCVRCGACVSACPVGAVSRTNGGGIEIDRQVCEGCGHCVAVCMSGARRIVGRTFTVDDMLHEIEKDEVFYYRSGGGVTVSGGEPMAQPEFTGAILQACAQRGIHTALETSAYGSWDQLARLVDSLDLIYVDIKHMDDAIHRRVTGVGNCLVLENLRKLMQNCNRPAVIVRVPVIPGINDAEQNLQRTADFVRELGSIERLELLPFHRYGLHSYKATGRICGLAAVPAPSDDRMQQLATLAGSSGIQVQIGG
jgi:pyruvate formate lyase activating enzyme